MAILLLVRPLNSVLDTVLQPISGITYLTITLPVVPESIITTKHTIYQCLTVKDMHIQDILDALERFEYGLNDIEDTSMSHHVEIILIIGDTNV